MEQLTYGGNLIRKINVDENKQQDFAREPYVYYYQQAVNETIVVTELKSFSVYVLNLGEAAQLTIDGIVNTVAIGDVVQVEGQGVSITVQAGSCELLIAGTREAFFETASVTLIKHDDIKYVNKPWGYELWLNGEHPGYAFKEIYIKTGTKTSLQYHEFKQETNVLIKGKANFFYKNNEAIKNDDVMAEDISSIELESISVMDVSPGILHRIEALSDIMLCEVSTPHLEDVIRVSDDSNRGHGRMDSEHGGKK